MTSDADPALRAVTVVPESAATRDGLFAGLAIVFLAALIRGVFGASTTAGRIGVIVILGATTIGVVAAGVYRRGRAYRLEVSDTSIELVVKGGAPRQALSKTSGDALQFVSVGSFRSQSFAIKIRGGDTALPLQFFSKKRVQAACRAHGWRFD